MGKSKKVAISQRWEKEFLSTVKSTAGKYSTSMTQLTIEALQIYVELSENDTFVNAASKDRVKKIVKILENEFTGDPVVPKQQDIDIEELQSFGFIRDQVAELLKMQPNKHFTTTQISDILEIPQSTARTYVRELSEENNQYHLIKGKPNKIFFKNGSS